VKEMLFQLRWSRQNYAGDYYIAMNNNDTVQLCSALLCAMIISTSALQLALLRRLFHRSGHVTKQRA